MDYEAAAERLKRDLVYIGDRLVVAPGALAADIVAPPELGGDLATWLGVSTGKGEGSDTFQVGGVDVRVYPCHHMPADEWHVVPFGTGCLSFHDLVDDAWRGQPCVIFGGGRSLSGFDWEGYARSHYGYRTIAASRAGADIPRSILLDLWVSSDRPFWEARRHRPGTLRVWVAPPNDPPLLEGCADRRVNWHGHQWNDTPPESLKDGIAGGGNSGFAAACLAYMLGADPIYLLGFDCTPGTWTSEPGKAPNVGVFNRWTASLHRLAAHAAERGRRIKWIGSGAAAPLEVVHGS